MYVCKYDEAQVLSGVMVYAKLQMCCSTVVNMTLL